MRRKLSYESLEERRLLAVSSLTVEPFLSGFEIPVVATHAGDGSGRLFVAEQGGFVHIIRDGDRVGRPFLDIRNELVTGGASGERGLLGLAFHPDYASAGADGEGKFYVYYSAPSLTGNHDSVVAEYQVSATDPDVADILSERTILRFNQPFSNHNGGDLKFGPDDGLLYISSGDGGSGSDPLDHGQNTSTLLGTILRVDINRDGFPADPQRNYAIPPSNPLVSDIEARDEIFAYGLRNPFRIAFDDGPQGLASPDRLFVGDVGQNTFEEVDIVTTGGNYGWNRCEGDHLFNDAGLACPAEFEPPIAEYGRGEGVSVIGGFVYRGSNFPRLSDVYIFGDLNGTVMVLEEQPDGTFERSVPMIEGTEPSSVIAFGEDEAGELYVLTFSGLLAIGAPADGDVTVDTAGEVRVEIDGDEVVVSSSSGESLRRPIDSITSLSINLSAGDDRLSLANVAEVLDLPIIINGDMGEDTLRLIGSGHALDLTTLPDDQLTNIEVIDLKGDGSNALTLSLDEVVSLSSSTNRIRVIHDEDDVIDYGDGWTADQPQLTEGELFHRLSQDAAIVEVANALSFQNPLDRYDANRVAQVTALDALQIVNALANRRGELTVPAVLDDPFVYFDVSGENVLSALDALQVINEIARRGSESEAEMLSQPFSSSDPNEKDIREFRWWELYDLAVLAVLIP